MPDTVEHRVEMHRLAQQRRAAGRPVWEHQVDVSDVFHNDDLTFEQRRDKIVARVRQSVWFKSKDESDDLPQWVEELADAEDTGEFDPVWGAIYDEADYDRVWIKTF